ENPFPETDADGRFTMELPEQIASQISLYAVADGHRGSASETITNTEMTLRMRPSHFLAGEIRDTDGHPAPETTVTAVGWEAGDDSEGVALTDAAGRYRIEGLSERMHYVGLESQMYGAEAGGETSV